MIVRNWMKTDPTVVPSDMLVSEAKRILREKNLRALPVVDDGRLRGVITRAICLRAAEFVTRSQDPSELDYFARRLKVKDLMVRRPQTVQASDTMEQCLRIGQEDGVSQFPVIDDGRVVGIISAAEIFHLAARVLGAWEKWSGITLAPMTVETGTLDRISRIVSEAGGCVESIFSVGGSPSGQKKVILRFSRQALDTVVAALEDAGYQVHEASSDVQNCRDGGHA